MGKGVRVNALQQQRRVSSAGEGDHQSRRDADIHHPTFFFNFFPGVYMFLAHFFSH